jgi:hypothetical protein
MFNALCVKKITCVFGSELQSFMRKNKYGLKSCKILQNKTIVFSCYLEAIPNQEKKICLRRFKSRSAIKH